MGTSSEALMVRGRSEHKKSGRRRRLRSKSKGSTKRKIRKMSVPFVAIRGIGRKIAHF